MTTFTETDRFDYSNDITCYCQRTFYTISRNSSQTTTRNVRYSDAVWKV